MSAGVRVAVVLVSHSAMLARGVAEVAAQMAPDVDLRPAGGTGDGGIGTSVDLVQDAVADALRDGADGVLLLTDLGSATLTAETVLELMDDDRVRFADAPFVEAAVAAAVAAQGGGDLQAVIAAAGTAAAPAATGAPAADGREGATGPAPSAGAAAAEVAHERVLTLRNPLGLHARPAAVVARRAAGFDATVTINGVDAASVLALMSLGLTGGAELELRATGPQAQDALTALAEEIESGFGEV